MTSASFALAPDRSTAGRLTFADRRGGYVVAALSVGCVAGTGCGPPVADYLGGRASARWRLTSPRPG
ncbi:MAG: hypothetical protein R2882_03585 [Gemmatimonadales bacterium]